jgi:arylsulfatase A-like enzyme
MMRFKRLPALAIEALIFVWLWSTSAAAFQRPRPNIVLILADDLGYMDIGANNPRTFYETPNIDALAKRGMRFTRGYAACPVCSPTRASLMTGKYPPRTGVTEFLAGERRGRLIPAPYAKQLALEEVTIAERLREAGYSTFFAGKWHLGSGDYSPNHQGFGPGLVPEPEGAMFYYPAGDRSPSEKKDDPKTSDRIAKEVERFIKASDGRPFFAYLPFQAVHTPLAARADIIEKYERKKASAPPDAWIMERDTKMRAVQSRAVYAAMLEQLDMAIGRVIAAIDRAGLADKTIVVFTSDNGGEATFAAGHPTSNLPLRAGKGWLYEGGIRVPWIICAPGVTQPGSICDTPVITTDLYPTLLNLAGLPPFPEQHRDGVSLLPLLEGHARNRPPLFWHYPHYGNQGGAPGGAVRDGDWKLIQWYEDGTLELFNLRDDPGETKNVAAENPAKVQELHAKLIAFRKDVNAIMPTPNPTWTGKAAAPKTNQRR